MIPDVIFIFIIEGFINSHVSFVNHINLLSDMSVANTTISSQTTAAGTMIHIQCLPPPLRFFIWFMEVFDPKTFKKLIKKRNDLVVCTVLYLLLYFMTHIVYDAVFYGVNF